MRKPIIIIISLFAAFPSALGAQAKEVPPIDLGFMLWDYLALYPEADRTNPANIMQLERPTLFNRASFEGSFDENTQKHTIGFGGPGAQEGERISTALESTNLIGVDGFFPIQEQTCAGFDAVVRLKINSSSMADTDWSADPERKTMQTAETVRVWTAGGHFAIRPFQNLDLGIRLGLSGSYDPWSLTWSTDSTIPEGDVPFISGYDSVDCSSWQPQLDLGGVYRSDSLTLGFIAALAWRGIFWTHYEVVDRDGNGLDETIVTREEYQTSTATWANGPHPEYDGKDESAHYSIALSPSMIWEAKPGVSLIVTGTFRVLDKGTRVMYEHLDSTDHSLFQLDYYDPIASLTVGVALARSPLLNIRMGIGYTWQDELRVVNSLDAAGDSVFSPANTGHYQEVFWTAEPSEDYVVASAFWSPFSAASHTARAIIAIECKPAPNVVLFGGADIDYRVAIDTYRVFNVADESVWEEKVFRHDVTMDYALLLGAGVFVTERTFVGLRSDVGSAKAGMDWNWSPTTGGRGTSGGEGPANDIELDAGSVEWSINLFCVVGL